MKQINSREFAGAREVQQRLSPGELARIDGLDYYGESQPCGELGGDFFDFIQTGDSSLLFSIGGVSAKGVAPAIIMAAVQGFLRALGSRMDFDIRKQVHNLNRLVWQLAPENFFVTMFCARLNASKREMQYVSAGHDRVMLLKAQDGREIGIKTTGAVLGLSTRAMFESRTVRMDPGDTVVAVTEGIAEAADFRGSALNNSVLHGLRERLAGSARDLAEYVIQTAKAQAANAVGASDDKTVVVVRSIGNMAEHSATLPIRPRRLAHAACL